MTIDTRKALPAPISPHLMRKTRGAFLLLGALLARFGAAEFSMPGGCNLGRRPVDFHLHAMEHMGAQITEGENGKLSARCRGLNAAELTLPFPSVGATQNILLAACGAAGNADTPRTILRGAAIEPEILELIDFLRAYGFSIIRSGWREFTVKGCPELCQTTASLSWELSPDRIAAATYLCAAAATGGEITLRDLRISALGASAPLYEKSGCILTENASGLTLSAPKRLRGIGTVQTEPHPGFPTDMQPLFCAMLCRADGQSRFIETIFENRFTHCAQLVQMGADIRLRQKTACITGVPSLYGRDLLAYDLRGGAALTIAALSAEGESRICGVEWIQRGYEDFFGTLNRLGAKTEPL